ncbi:MAG TPA: hypothetical protein VFD55_02630, partial [Candidatus Angelobacter sp.]|nr:hypothetical protein [Candidatus Angelobacter sp.]
IEPAAISEPVIDKKLEVNPYPDIQQSVIEPIKPVPKPSTTTSEKAAPAGIINLANNADFSIETIAREANRLHEKQDLTEEVVISLR